MSTSDRVVAAEIGGVAALAIAILAIASPGDPWLLAQGYHPAWVIVTLFAARYGTRGLILALALVWGGLVATSLVADGTLVGLAQRAARASELYALAVAIVVAWIAALHEARIARLARRFASADQRRREADATVDAMREVIGFLRARADRIDMSVSLWRDIATRLDRGDPAEAAAAALELCLARAGASTGAVHRWDGARLSTLVGRGGAPADPGVIDIAGDRTALAAATRGRPVLVTDVAGAGTEDSDLAVPVAGTDGVVLGVIALRGAAPGPLRGADLGDAVAVARWLAPVLASIPQAERRRSASEGPW